MFSRKEFKSFIIKFGKKILFPDFTNKLTWMVAGAGASIIITPTPLKVIFYNFIVDTFKINSGQYFTVADLQTQSADYMIGFGLILLALLHNLSYKYLDSSKKAVNESKREADISLFNRFLKELPSGCTSIRFLCDHDLGATFPKESTNELLSFINQWNTPEYMFLDEELEKEKTKLYETIEKFISELAVQAGFIPESSLLMTVIPNAYFISGQLPDDVRSMVLKFNENASLCCEQHQSFIVFCKKRLLC